MHSSFVCRTNFTSDVQCVLPFLDLDVLETPPSEEYLIGLDSMFAYIYIHIYM